jgi:hypothetical protein
MAVHGSLRMDAFDHAELVIIASTIGLSILLSILSFSSYRKTKLNTLKKKIFSIIKHHRLPFYQKIEMLLSP